MTQHRIRVQRTLEEWKGSDSGERKSPREIANDIDLMYREYLDSLAHKTAAILKGQKAQERRVA